MQTLIFSATNGFISMCYFIIGLLMLMPFLRGQLKTPLVLATILIFLSCGLGHGAHAVLMGRAMPLPASWLNLQIGIDLITAIVAITYISLRRSYSLLIDAPLLLTQTQHQLAQTNAELERVNANLEQLVQARTAELVAANQQLEQEIRDRTLAETALQSREVQLQQQANDLQQAIANLQQAQLQLVQREKMSALGQLVAGIAHELNNPVNFIYGNLTPAHDYVASLMNLLALYQQHCPEPPVKIAQAIEQIDLDFIRHDLPRLLHSMRVGADRIQKIVLSLRNFSRMDESEKKIVDLHEGINSTLLILQSQLKATGRQQAIEVIKDYGELPPVECYAGQLNQVFMNLLTNAIDALSDRRRSGVNPQILIRTRHSAIDRVAIEISDNGAGIPLEVQSHIFDPFFTTKPVGAGTGLGLAISYQIMEKHQGTLTCVSQPEHTTFRIELPLQVAAGKLAAV